jgi:hypothetical protein
MPGLLTSFWKVLNMAPVSGGTEGAVAGTAHPGCCAQPGYIKDKTMKNKTYSTCPKLMASN